MKFELRVKPELDPPIKTQVPESDRWERYPNEWLTAVTVVQRHWICPLCKQPKSFVTVNDHIVLGCAPATFISSGHWIDHCNSEVCVKEAGARIRQAKETEQLKGMRV